MLFIREDEVMRRSSRGFSFMEILIVMAIMGIIASIALKNMGRADDKVNYEISLAQLQKLKLAIIGNENARSNDERLDFGFVGDIGALPSSLDDLLLHGSLGSSKLDTSILLSYGWMGPYLKVPFTGDPTGFKTDEWGNEFVYTTTNYVNGTGDTVVAKLTSLGADGAVGGTGYSADIFVEIFKDQVSSDVTGCVFDINGNPAVGVTVRLYEPDGAGAITSKSGITDATGCYTIKNLSQGIRSFTFQDVGGVESEGFRITLASSFAAVIDITTPGSILLVGIPEVRGGNNQDLRFSVQNNLGIDITIVDFVVSYTPFDAVTGPKYEDMKFAGTTLWTFGATRAGSGDLLSNLNTFSNILFKKGNTDIVDLKKFKDNTGTDVDITGFIYTATFFSAAGESYVVGPFIAGGQPTLLLVPPPNSGVGKMDFDVKNNTGGDLIITDMKFEYSPFNVVTGPKFEKVKFDKNTAWQGPAFSAGSGDLLSGIATFNSQTILNGQTVNVKGDRFKDNNGNKIDLKNYIFTVTFYTATTQYIIGPMTLP